MTKEERAEAKRAVRKREQISNNAPLEKYMGDVYEHGYIDGATEQHRIDVKNACKAVCSFCQDKERCDAESWDAIENTRLAVSCEKIDKLVEAMEEQDGCKKSKNDTKG